MSAVDDSKIGSFSFEAPQEALADLRRRIAATKWPSREIVADASQGVQLATMRELARYWQAEYDWRKFEARLNGLPQFTTNIDGVEIHFIHVRSKHDGALPVIVTHGWPGSIIEQLKIVDPLTNPTAHGASASDAFDVVIPSLPGHGFSGAPTVAGWDPIRIARAWIVLMKRLGYTRFVAQGGDWGNAVTEQMALQRPPESGRHPHQHAGHGARRHRQGAGFPTRRRLPASSPTRSAPGISSTISSSTGSATPAKWRTVRRRCTGSGFPVGLAAWMLDHDAASEALIARVFAGQSEGLTRDDILDNVTLYWLTNTAVSSARLYWESKLDFFAPKGVPIATAVSVFPDEIYAAPRNWAERAYPKLVHYNRLEKGGHFAAWEQPAAFCSELRAGFRALRGSSNG